MAHLTLAAATGWAVFTAFSGEAEACGGCLHAEDPEVVGSSESTVVTGHRMALSISTERTVLWDQITYAGAPEDFAWVLPVGKGARLELASGAWFESLEAVTSVRVRSESVTCTSSPVGSFSGGEGAPSGSESGCSGGPIASYDAANEAGSTATGGSPAGPEEDPVSVVHEETVGPYETVTLSSEDPEALRSWLTDNGYAIPAEIDPIIDEYVANGADFIALRLAPSAEVRQMQPVRVVTPGASPILPLKMVAAGTGASTSIVLYVIGEGRYGTENFPRAELAPGELSWNWDTSSSNYGELRADLVADNYFLTSFAQRGAIHRAIDNGNGFASYQVEGGPESYQTLADLYFGQAQRLGLADGACPALGGLLDSDSVVVDTCDADGHCTDPGPGEIAMHQLACGEANDIAAALLGMHPADVWITRLEAELDRSAFQTDLVLGADEQLAVRNHLVASESVGDPCADVTAQNRPREASGAPVRSAAAGAIFLAAFALRRRRSRRAER